MAAHALIAMHHEYRGLVGVYGTKEAAEEARRQLEEVRCDEDKRMYDLFIEEIDEKYEHSEVWINVSHDYRLLDVAAKSENLPIRDGATILHCDGSMPVSAIKLKIADECSIGKTYFLKISDSE